MRVTAVSLFVLGLAAARPSAAQTPIGELPAPYIQQVPPPAQTPQARAQPPAAPGGPAQGDRIYGPPADSQVDPNNEQVEPVEPNLEPPQPQVQELPPPYQPPEQQPAEDYAGEYDMSTDNTVAQSYDDGYDPQAAAQFDQTLSPYGTWIDDPSYGRVWQPSTSIVGAGFFPYATNGRWALTEYGWTWISDWDWGWAPFHYGRWTMLGGRGWCWVPGTLWGPAWVGWRAGGGYVGWTPLPPRGVWIGQPVGAGSRWRFTQASMMGTSSPAYLSGRAAGSVFGRTTVVSNARTLSVAGGAVAVNAGPTRVLSASPTGRLSEVAPHALPRVAVQPRLATPFAARPWVRAGLTAAPSTYGRPVSHTGAPFRAAPAYRAPVYTNGVRPGGFVPPAARPFGPHSSQPAPRAYSGRMAGWYSPPPYRSPAPYHSTYVAPRTFAPGPRAYAAPAPHFSAPAPAPHFSAPRSSSFGGGGHFGGGGRRR